jgi:hypothetical protein
MKSIISNKQKKILTNILSIIKTTPNDMVLGEKIRKLYYKELKYFDKYLRY